MKKLYVNLKAKTGVIAPEIYGHFTEQIGGVVYDGLWVGKESSVPHIHGFRKEIIEKLKAIHAPVLRWPGGCFSETYHWRDGIGQERPDTISWWTMYDHRYEPNTVGTDEFLDLCEIVGAKPYIAANITSMTPLDIRDWMNYCMAPEGATALARERAKNGHPKPYDVTFWGVGNENWGGGGNMRPEYYADECRKYGTLMNNAFPDASLIICGANSTDYRWTHQVACRLENQKQYLSGYAVHHYCSGGGNAVDYTAEEWKNLLRSANIMEEIVRRHWNILCGYGVEDRIKLVVDEWGCWHPEGSGPSSDRHLFEQQSTLRDAVVSALTLNIFNNHCDKVMMANAAQLVNCLHSLFLATEDRCIVTPVYHVFDLYQGHMGATAVQTTVENNEDFDHSITVSSSVKEGTLLVTAANLSYDTDTELSLTCFGGNMAKIGTARLLTAQDVHAHNTFENPGMVKPAVFSFETDRPVLLPKGSVMALSVPIEE